MGALEGVGELLDVWAVMAIDCKVAGVMAIEKVPVIPW